ncbi:MAG: Rrf2 family transcriptional regulator [Gammaproteobacteria bacterium]|nr:MAG: Rrf2 family transcriptional regulator [Gammaproteobacteria bacterium]
MKLSTKGRYAVTAMFDIALHHQTGPVSLSDIADRQGISLSYLEQLFTRLRQQGLVKSTRGPGGGYSLAVDSKQIAISDVIDAVDESVDATRCGGKADCQNHQRCLTHDLWENLSGEIRSYLSNISLAQAVSDLSVREVANRQDLNNNHQVHRVEFS